MRRITFSMRMTDNEDWTVRAQSLGRGAIRLCFIDEGENDVEIILEPKQARALKREWDRVAE
jgi:hypothetical protein